MKSISKILAVLFVLALGAVAYGETITNRGEVITVTTLEEVTAATADTNVVTLLAGPYASILVPNQVDLTAAEMTAYVPQGPGQQAISLAATGTTKIVYGSVGWTTNDWILIK